MFSNVDNTSVSQRIINDTGNCHTRTELSTCWRDNIQTEKPPQHHNCDGHTMKNMVMSKSKLMTNNNIDSFRIATILHT